MSAVFASRPAPSAIIPAQHEHARCFNWFIVFTSSDNLKKNINMQVIEIGEF